MQAPFFTFDQLVEMMQQNINHVKNTRFWNKKSKKQVADMGYATLSAESPRSHARLVSACPTFLRLVSKSMPAF